MSSSSVAASALPRTLSLHGDDALARSTTATEVSVPASLTIASTEHPRELTLLVQENVELNVAERAED